MLPISCAGAASVRKAITEVQKTYPAACEKWSVPHHGRASLRTGRRRMSVGGEPLNGLSTRLSKPGPPVRPLKGKELGTVGELGSSYARTEVPGTGPQAPNVFARGTGDIDMGDEVAQRGFSDAESIEVDEVQEPRRRNSPSDPTSRQFEEHVLTGHASFRSWCAACVPGCQLETQKACTVTCTPKRQVEPMTDAPLSIFRSFDPAWRLRALL